MAVTNDYTSLADSNEFEQMERAAAIIDDWKVFATGETFGEHRKYCDGCPDCLVLRRKRNKLLMENEQIAGIKMYKIVNLRAQHDRGIDFYFPQTSEIYDSNGEIDRDNYIFLQVKGFTDDQIRNYFGIKSDDWNVFKTKYFPNWRQKSHEYLSIYTQNAVKQWAASHPKQVYEIEEAKKERHKVNSSRI